MRNPDPAEVLAFAAVCALALFVPSTPLVAHFAAFTNARGIAAPEAASLLLACVFGCLAGLALLVSFAFASARRLRR
jgi:hypothetical protein